MSIERASRSCAALACAIALSGCASDGPKSTSTIAPVNKAYVTAPAPLTGDITCPISGQPVTTHSPNAMYGVFPVYCATLEDARQFAALPKAKRAELATAQVLPQKRITNATCPLTGERLTAAAAPVLYEGEIIGFASVADANQFMSLPAKKRKQCIDEWKASAASGT
ncbi:MAG: hypothetical protein U0572_07605 [Phycisphaerales bacterium]